MKIKSVLKFLIVAVLSFVALFLSFELAAPIKYRIDEKFIKYSTKSSIKKVGAENLAYNSLNNKNLLPRNVIFDKEGIDNIALIYL